MKGRRRFPLTCARRCGCGGRTGRAHDLRRRDADTDPPDPIETASIVYSGGSGGQYLLTSSVAGSYLPDAAPPALATLTVDEAPLIVLMEFSPSTIAQGGVSRLSYGLRNGAAVGATSISLSDTLPADVVVAGVPDASTTCGGGTVTAAAGGNRSPLPAALLRPG